MGLRAGVDVPLNCFMNSSFSRSMPVYMRIVPVLMRHTGMRCATSPFSSSASTTCRYPRL